MHESKLIIWHCSKKNGQSFTIRKTGTSTQDAFAKLNQVQRMQITLGCDRVTEERLICKL